MIDEVSRASSIFFDTAPFIYYVEEDPSFFPLVEPIFQAFDSGAKEAIASHITLAEALTKPFQLGRDDLALRYKKVLLMHRHVRLFPVDAEVAEEAARVRARYKVKRTPDAIQLATAKLRGAQVFVTNDHELKRFRELPVVVLSEYIKASPT